MGKLKKKSGRSGLLILLLLAVGGAGAAAAYFYFAGGGADQVAQVAPEPRLVPSESTNPPPPDRLTPGEPPVTDPSAEQPDPQPPQSVTEQTPPETVVEGDPPETVVNRAATLMETVDNFDGGRCFHAAASDVGGNSLVIEGFGLTRDPFVKLEQAVRDAHGVEPKIGLRQIVESQCAIVDFLNGVRSLEKSKPVLDLSNDWIKSGDSLRGSVSRIGDKIVSIFLIDNEGVVYNLGPHLKRIDDKAEFNIKLVELAPRDPLPQLILTVASSTPIALLQVSDPVLAKSFFPAVLKAITNGDAEVGTAVKFFKLGG